MRRSAYLLAILAALAALSVGMVALGASVGRVMLPDALVALDERLPVVFRAHMLLSGLGLILLPLALATRRWAIRWHRSIGRMCAMSLVLGSLAALPSAVMSVAAPLARTGFLVQGLATLWLLAAAVLAIRRGDARRHGALMRAMTTVVAGVIVLRLVLAACASLGWWSDDLYAILAWGSWIIPLAIVEGWTRLPSRLARPSAVLDGERQLRRMPRADCASA